MTDLFFTEDGGTPLSPDEKRGLIPAYISTRGELNSEEQKNITKAEVWAMTRRHDILSVDALKKLHSRMYGDVWDWAGSFSQVHDRQLGVQPYEIELQLRQLIDDVRYWIENHTFPPDEIAARFHHKLVYIHAFPNGNGRHARLATDILMRAMGQSPFTWGRGDLRSANELRDSYIAALRAADYHDMEPLLIFVRTHPGQG